MSDVIEGTLGREIRLVSLDVDGVLTDGSLWIGAAQDAGPSEVRRFHARHIDRYTIPTERVVRMMKTPDRATARRIDDALDSCDEMDDNCDALAVTRNVTRTALDDACINRRRRDEATSETDTMTTALTSTSRSVATPVRNVVCAASVNVAAVYPVRSSDALTNEEAVPSGGLAATGGGGSASHVVSVPFFKSPAAREYPAAHATHRYPETYSSSPQTSPSHAVLPSVTSSPAAFVVPVGQARHAPLST